MGDLGNSAKRPSVKLPCPVAGSVSRTLDPVPPKVRHVKRTHTHTVPARGNTGCVLVWANEDDYND